MIDLARRGASKFLAMFAVFIFAFAAGVAPASAQGLFSQIRYAAIVVDASNGEVLYAKRADDLRYPASITKIMTLYLTFEALSTGRLKPTDRVPVSAHAFGMAPSKSSLRPGESLSVDDAMRIVAVHSANDIAVALAEKIGGSEQRFAALMTLRAQELGMANTRFVNAHGLPDARQVTTARDFAILARAVIRDYPQYFNYFGLRQCEVAGKVYQNHNHLLREPGYDGFKTGFTNAAGYNLVASAVHDSRRLITVVLGGSSAALRDENVQTLMNAGFDVLKKRSLGERTTIAANIAEPDDRGPIQPSIEEGDGGRPGLSAVVIDPVHGPIGDQLAEEEKLATMAAPPPGLRGKAVAKPVAVAKGQPCGAARNHGHHHTAACKSEKIDAVQVAAADCGKKHGKAKHACEGKDKTVTLAKGKAKGKSHAVALAKAAPAKGGKDHHAHHHHADA